MAETRIAKEPETDIHEYADGWISERKGTGVPTFLKFAYIVIAAGAIAYFIIYMNGEVNHSDRGFLVRQLNRATTAAPLLMYSVVALVAIYAIITIVFAFKSAHKD